MILGIFTAVLLVMYLGIVLWAYSGRRRQDFAEAAQLPLVEGDAENRDPARRENAASERPASSGSGRVAGTPGLKRARLIMGTSSTAGGRNTARQMHFVASNKESHP